MAAIDGMSLGGRARKRNMDKLRPFELKAVPALINTLNGMNYLARRDLSGGPDDRYG